MERKYNIAVAGTGYVGLSIATLLAQHNRVTAVDVILEKVDALASYTRISPKFPSTLIQAFESLATQHDLGADACCAFIQQVFGSYTLRQHPTN